MRIAYLDPYPVPGMTPSGMQILQMADAFAQAGSTLQLVTPASAVTVEAVLGRSASPRLENVHLRDLRKRWFFPFSSHKPFFLQTMAWLRRHRPDAIFVRNLKLAAWLLPRVDIPVFFESHEIFAQTFREEHRGGLKRRLQRKYDLLLQRETQVYRDAAGLFALTEALADDIRERYGVTKPIAVLPDGVDLTLVERAQEKRASRAIRSASEPVRLLYLGSLHPWKGVDVAVRAMPELAGTELWIAGGERARIEELHALSQQLGCADRIHFLGKVAPPDRFDLIDQCDICLLPLRSTSIGARFTSPLKLFEYMGMGKPVVASALPSIREVIRHGENGWLCEPESPSALAEAVRQLVTNPACAKLIGKRAAQDALGYGWVRRAEHALDVMARAT